MSLVTMQALLADAEKGGYALGGFVTTDLMVTQSLIQASEEMGAPLILMIPWGTTLDKHRPDEYLRLTVEMARSANVPVAVHLDHGTSYEECIKAINAGFTSVMFDGSSLPMAGASIPRREFAGKACKAPKSRRSHLGPSAERPTYHFEAHGFRREVPTYSRKRRSTRKNSG